MKSRLKSQGECIYCYHQLWFLLPIWPSVSTVLAVFKDSWHTVFFCEEKELWLCWLLCLCQNWQCVCERVRIKFHTSDGRSGCLSHPSRYFLGFSQANNLGFLLFFFCLFLFSFPFFFLFIAREIRFQFWVPTILCCSFLEELAWPCGVVVTMQKQLCL